MSGPPAASPLTASAQGLLAWDPPASGRVGVACSGGLDSKVLLELVRRRMGRDVGRLLVVHVDHGLRPDSGAVAAAVAEEAGEHGVEHHLERITVAAEGPSLEARAREARYAVFRRVARQRRLVQLLLAHHADDQAEGLAMRILRRSGPRGLRGMLRERALTPGCRLVRPLLDARRRELACVAADLGLGWHEDPGNRDPRHLRNRLRHQLLPRLDDLVGGAHARLLGLSRHAALLQRRLASVAGELRTGIVAHRLPGLLALGTDPVAALPDTLAHAVLAPLLEDAGLAAAAGRGALQRLLAAARRPLEAWKEDLPGGVRLRRQGRRLWLLGWPAQPESYDVAVEDCRSPLGGRITAQTVWGKDGVRRALEESSIDPWLVVLDARSLHGPPRITPALPGLVVRPLGAPGRRPVRTILAEAGCPAFLRPFMPVVRDAEGPLWPPPGPQAERTRVAGDCDRALILAWRHAPSGLLVS